MKRFIDKNGTFEISIPVTWKHSTKDTINIFQEYEMWKPDSFQISIKNLDSKITKSLKSLTLDVEKNYYQIQDTVDEKFTTKAWMKTFTNNYVIFSFTYLNNPDTELDPKSIKDKLELIDSIISDFKLINKIDSESTLEFYRFDMFLQGVGVTSLILNKAVENKAFIEATCILANQIDALLRIGIILKNQITNKNSEIELEWIYQGLSDKKKSEKDIYKIAIDLDIIDQNIHDKLNLLYNDRNRVIHRFIISEITLAEVEEIAYKYYEIQKEINELIYKLEKEQINLNIGMTVLKNQEDIDHIDYIKGKIGKLNYFDNKTITTKTLQNL